MRSLRACCPASTKRTVRAPTFWGTGGPREFTHPQGQNGAGQGRKCPGSHPKMPSNWGPPGQLCFWPLGPPRPSRQRWEWPGEEGEKVGNSQPQRLGPPPLASVSRPAGNLGPGAQPLGPALLSPSLDWAGLGTQRELEGSLGPGIVSMTWVLRESLSLSRLQCAPLWNESGRLRTRGHHTVGSPGVPLSCLLLPESSAAVPPAPTFQLVLPQQSSSVSALKQTNKPLDPAPPSFSPFPLVHTASPPAPEAVASTPETATSPMGLQRLPCLPPAWL